MASLVALAPVPAITGTLPATTSTQRLTTWRCSPTSSVADSRGAYRDNSMCAGDDVPFDKRIKRLPIYRPILIHGRDQGDYAAPENLTHAWHCLIQALHGKPTGQNRKLRPRLRFREARCAELVRIFPLNAPSSRDRNRCPRRDGILGGCVRFAPRRVRSPEPIPDRSPAHVEFGQSASRSRHVSPLEAALGN